MASIRVPTTRSAFTLLEMVLAAAVAVLLLAALYVAMDLQLRHAEAAREVVTETTLARTLLNRIADDIAPDFATADPTRYKQSGGGGSGGGGSGGSGSSGGGGNSGGSSGGTSGNTNAVTNSDGTVNTFASTSGTDATASPQGLAVLALQGNSGSLTLYVSRVPPGPSANGTMPSSVSDQRRIVYWLVEGGGLARQELTAVTSEDAMNGNVPSGMPTDPKQLIAKEVQSLQFQYFDGTNWQDSWDGAQVGPDNATPIGPPVAVAITIGIASGDEGDVKMYRHVVAIPTANSPSSTQAQGSTNGSSGSSGSNSSSSSNNSSSGGSGNNSSGGSGTNR
jgi:uncharacterized membrane protein YgcG